MRFNRTRISQALVAALGLSVVPYCAAQVIRDGSIGPAAAPILPTGNRYDILQSHGQTVGTNLFHSFSQFDIAQGMRATFSGAPAITNIINRVTGGTRSTIDGTLRSEIAGANLFLINAHGISFGSTARIEVSGAFHASTAHYLALGPSDRFDTLSATTPVLSSAPPSAFGFVAQPVADIAITGATLLGERGAALTLTGGTIQISGGALVAAPSGFMGIASVAGPGEIALSAADLLTQAGMARGAITVTNSAVGASSGGGLPGGKVVIRGGVLTLQAGATVGVDNAGPTAAQGVVVDASESLSLTGGNTLLGSLSTGAGRGGDVTITTPTLTANGAIISTAVSGTGSGGDVSIQAGTVSLTNGAQILATSTGPGAAGNLTVEATTSVDLSGRGNSRSSGFSTSGTADGASGSIVVRSPVLNVDNAIILANASGTGSAGNITLAGEKIAITGGSLVSSSTLAQGPASTVNISASESLTISGQDAGGTRSAIAGTNGGDGTGAQIVIDAPVVTLDSGSITTVTSAGGPGGSINIDANRVALTNGGLITSNSTGGGRSGDVTITASESISMSGTFNGAAAGVVARAFSTGDGGTVALSAPTITLDGARVNVSTDDAGTAGNIAITAGRLFLANGGFLDSSTTAEGHAGRVNVIASESVTMSGASAAQASAITSTASAGGSAGEIQIVSPRITLDGAQISGTTSGAGAGGSIDIATTVLELSNKGQISSNTTGPGSGGRININAVESVRVTSPTAGPLQAGIFAGSFARGRGGEIALRTPLLTVAGGTIATTTSGAGDAGRIFIQGQDISVAAGGLIDSSSLAGSGAGGVVNVAASRALTIAGTDASGARSRISSGTTGPGAGGDVLLNAPTLTVDNGSVIVSTGARGAAGRIAIDAQRLTIVNGGELVSGTSGAGDGGTLNVTATESIVVSGGNGDNRSRISNGSTGAGNAGEVALTAPSIHIENRGFVRGTASAGGSAGNISLRGSALTLASGGEISTSATASGRGGAIDVRMTESVSMTDSAIRATSGGAGDAGSIFVDAGRSLTMIRSAITTEATRADGGNIELNAIDILRLTDSEITTSVGNGVGNGGNIIIDPVFVVLDGSRIIANAFGGNGGNINITTDALLKSGDSVIEASSQLGISGTITISSPDADLAGGLTPLTGGLFDPSLLLRESCSARAGRAGNSFVGVGHGGLPTQPGSLAFSSYAQADMGSAAERGPVFALAETFANACAR